MFAHSTSQDQVGFSAALELTCKDYCIRPQRSLTTARMDFPSIQSFFGREVKKPKIKSEPSTESPVKQEEFQDGFTSSEINEVLDPSTIDSNLPRAYEPCPIMLLQPGARHYEIGGRIVNFSTNARKRQNLEESEGFWYLTVSDGTGMIGVSQNIPAHFIR